VKRRVSRVGLVATLLLGALAALYFVDASRLPSTPGIGLPIAIQAQGDAPRSSSITGTGAGAKELHSSSRPSSPSEAMRIALLSADSFAQAYQALIVIDPSMLEAHEQFYLAFILETCQFASLLPERTLQEFSAASAPNAADTARIAGAKRRIAKRSLVAMCQGIAPHDGTDLLIAELYAAAADRGDPRATAWVLQRELELAGGESGIANLKAPAAPDEAQRAQLLQALASQDPMAIVFAGRLLTRGYSDFGVAFGPDQITPSYQLQEVLWELVACDYGANCGADRLQLDQICASSGRCSTASYQDHLRQHVLTPQDLQDFARIYPFITAGIRHGDWSGLHFLGATPGNYSGISSRRFGLGG
jgi:hypothetical protein